MSNLRMFRKGCGLTQVRLAQLTGLDQSLISKIERGTIRNPSWHLVARLSRAVNGDPRDVFPVQPLEQAS